MTTTEALIGALQLQIGALVEELARTQPASAARVSARAIQVGRLVGADASADFLQAVLDGRPDPTPAPPPPPPPRPSRLAQLRANKKLVAAVGAVLFVVLAGIVVLWINRYQMTITDNTAFVLDRWTGDVEHVR